MEDRKLARSGLWVSPLCLGGMTFGEADEESHVHGIGTDDASAIAIMNDFMLRVQSRG